MRLHGRLGDERFLRDLRVRQPAREVAQHLELARRELLELGGRLPHGVRRPPHELLDHATRDRRREQRVAVRDDVDRVDELLGRRVLEQEPARADSQRLVHVLVEVEGREDEDARALLLPVEQSAGRLEPVDVRHADVHQDHVRLHAVRGVHRLRAVGRLADDLDVLLGVEDHPESRPNERLVVDDEDADPPRRGGESVALRVDELVESHRLLEVLQAPLTELRQHESAQVFVRVLEHRDGRAGYEDLPTGRLRADPRRRCTARP